MKIEKKEAGRPGAAVLDTLVFGRQASPSDRGPPKAAEALRIVLLEDSEPDAELIQQTLVDSGIKFSLVTVDTLEKFEGELSHRPPNLILSDYWLPLFDGSTALESAKQLAPDVPFIFVTGIMGEEVVIEMLKRGATDYVLKTRLARLAPAVNRALAESEQRREHQKAQERLRRSHDQLRALTGHLQFVREEERTRIAREVHDELGQALTGLKLDLSWLSGKVAGKRALQSKIKAMSAGVDDTIHTVRRIATELRPGVLDSLGLAAAIEWQALDFQQRTGIRCEVKIEVKEAIWDQEFSTICFRIYQETLTNIIRHSKATHVDVRLAQIGNELVLTVRDNGRGISEKEIINARSIGLIGMRERVAQVGGEVFFFGLPGRGTTVTMRVPMPKAAIRSQGVA
jgi:signal transduction histidine kinase